MNQEICRVFFFLLKRREDVDREASCSRWNRRRILDTIMSAVDLCSTNKNLICQSLMCVWCDLVIGRFNNTGFYQ